jgi:hypothetical protein
MIKTGVSGGMINLNSFLNKSDRNEIENSNTLPLPACDKVDIF